MASPSAASGLSIFLFYLVLFGPCGSGVPRVGAGRLQEKVAPVPLAIEGLVGPVGVQEGHAVPSSLGPYPLDIAVARAVAHVLDGRQVGLRPGRARHRAAVRLMVARAAAPRKGQEDLPRVRGVPLAPR